MIGKLRELLWLRGGEWVVSFTTREDPSSLFNELKDAAVHIEIKKAANRRSRDANAFAWVLIDKIAEKTRPMMIIGRVNCFMPNYFSFAFATLTQVEVP